MSGGLLFIWRLYKTICSLMLQLLGTVSITQSVSVFTRPSPPFLVSSPLLFLIKTLVTWFRAHTVNPGWSHLEIFNLITSLRTLFWIRSHLWVLEVKTCTLLFGGSPLKPLKITWSKIISDNQACSQHWGNWHLIVLDPVVCWQTPSSKTEPRISPAAAC